jgi:hypothetical protein
MLAEVESGNTRGSFTNPMTGNLSFCTVLIFSQASVAPTGTARPPAWRRCLPSSAWRRLKHLELPFPGKVLAVENRHLDGVLTRQIQQRLLALDLGQLPHIPIPPEEVEGVIDKPALPAGGKFRLQFGEIGSAFMDDRHLAIDDGLAWYREGGAGDLGEALGPIEPVAGVDLFLPEFR